MIQCKVLSHSGAETIEYSCEACGRIQVRCYGKHITREIYEKTCWFCSKKQPQVLNLVCNQSDRIQYYSLSTIPPVISGIY